VKIALSGSACTGKTTLGLELSSRLGLPLIPESFDILFNLPRSKADKGNDDKIVNAFFRVLELKQEDEKKHRQFIVDRCPVDLLNLWLAKGLGRRPVMTERFYQACMRLMRRYDYIVIPPWGILPLQPLHTESGNQVRNLNKWSLLYSQATIIGLARMLTATGKLIVIPETVETVDNRVKFILQRIK